MKTTICRALGISCIVFRVSSMSWCIRSYIPDCSPSKSNHWTAGFGLLSKSSLTGAAYKISTQVKYRLANILYSAAGSLMCKHIHKQLAICRHNLSHALWQSMQCYLTKDRHLHESLPIGNYLFVLSTHQLMVVAFELESSERILLFLKRQCSIFPSRAVLLLYMGSGYQQSQALLFMPLT